MTIAVTRCVGAADRPGTEPRSGGHRKIPWEEGDRRAALVQYGPGATIPRLVVISGGGTEPLA